MSNLIDFWSESINRINFLSQLNVLFLFPFRFLVKLQEFNYQLKVKAVFDK